MNLYSSDESEENYSNVIRFESSYASKKLLLKADVGAIRFLMRKYYGKVPRIQSWFMSLRMNCGVEVIHSLTKKNLSRINEICPLTNECALSIAVQKGLLEVVRMLLDFGASPKLKCKGYLFHSAYSATPLIIACRSSSPEIYYIINEHNKQTSDLSLRQLCVRKVRFLLRFKYPLEDNIQNAIRTFDIPESLKQALSSYLHCPNL